MDFIYFMSEFAVLDLRDEAHCRVRSCPALGGHPKSVSQYRQYSHLIVEGRYTNIFALQKCVEHEHCAASVCLLHIIIFLLKLTFKCLKYV